ncbi:MAG: phosphoenolpyruvate hydrolase family protein [Acidobacteriia bacterium]|nr:phosphoenolpyruvate hydrolase family protein [Methyloceanibacter sp.]MBX5472097.1 phosphoenolpyruvate hydrolase family protein [Acetobacteraceae bacterium]MCL6492477.1 phosphoenolpyruvate hydrolase family protein [Terriglobia bacterium]
MPRIPRSEILARLHAMKAKGEPIIAAGAGTGLAALKVNPHALIHVHGGPIAELADAESVFAHSRYCNGFYGASSMERLPVERALSAEVPKFKSIKKGQRNEKKARALARR